MKLSALKDILLTAPGVHFILENGDTVPENFHVTEVGVVIKHFIDCGGTVREERKAKFQLWDANDYEHRLKPAKLLKIIELSEKVLGMDDLEIEVEYQQGTIGKYTLEYNGTDFLLVSTQTACLVQESCGVPSKEKINLSNLKTAAACTPGGSCC